MAELKALLSEAMQNFSKQHNSSQKYAFAIVGQVLLCALSLLYCIATFYHYYYKGLICFIGSVAVTSATYVTVKYRASPLGLLCVCTLVTFVFVHVMTRKWAYLSNDHDIVNDHSY